MSTRIVGQTEANSASLQSPAAKNIVITRPCTYCKALDRNLVRKDNDQVRCAETPGPKGGGNVGHGSYCIPCNTVQIFGLTATLLNVTTCSDGGRLGLLGGVLGCVSATEGLAWIISVRAIVNVKNESTL
jgi:hypothetical protein